MSTIRVDRITPYQSGSVAIEGLNITNLTIDGTLTASLQQGYVWVGNSSGRTTAVSTGSFGGGGADITALNSFTASQQALNTTFADTGSNSFIGNQQISGSLSVTGDDRVASINPGVVLIHSGSSRATLAPNSVVLIHSESVNNSNIIGFSASPTHFSIPGLANVNEPSIFTADSSSNYYQAIEFQSQGRFAQNKVSFKVPVDVSGSLTISGSTTQVGNQRITGSLTISGSTTQIGDMILTGSLTISGSSTFRNIGPTILSGSVNISGSINSDGYELAASSTSTIPVLNSTFNLDLSGSSIYSTNSFINKSLVLGDGKVLIAGKFQSIDGHTTNDIARLNSNGTIDASFTAPLFAGQFGEFDYFINTFVTQSDSKIIVGGTFSQVSGSNRRGLARLNTNGTLDESFVTQSWGSFGEVRDIAIQNDGKIVVVGYFTSGSRRINTDGTLDTSYNVSTGSNQPSFFNNEYFYSVALLDSGSDQAVLIGGSFSQWGSLSNYHHLVKLNPNGTLDFGFGGTNLDILWSSDGYTAGDRIEKIKVGDDGYIYVAGRFKDTGIGNNAGFARITTTDEGNGVGAIDTGFRTYISGSYVNDFDFYDGGKILLGGSFTTFGNPSFSTTSANRFAIVDQNDGGLVSNWSTDGLASKYNLNTGSVNSVSLLPSDNVLVGGTFTSASFPSTAREGLASLKLTGFGNVTTTTDYSITADTTQLLISSSNTYFSGDITASTISGSFVGNGSGLTNLVLPSGVVSGSSQLTSSLDSRYLNVSGEGTISGSFTGSFVGDGSGLTNIPGVTPINTGSFATTGSNTFFGDEIISGSLIVSGSISQKGLGGGSNIVIGDDPITNLTSDAQNNTVIGADAGALLRSGSNNVFIGKMAGLLNQDANSNVFIGSTAGYNAKSAQNIYIGESAGFSNISGRYNVAIGHNAGYNNKVSNNTFVGYQTGFANTSGSDNTFVGYIAGGVNTTGNNNSFFGSSAGRDNSVGQGNVFLGNYTGQTNTSGSFNTFVGYSAGQNHKTAVYNTFVGNNAGLNTGVGNENTFLGFQAGVNNLSGSQNTLIGANANALSTFSNYVTAIGYGAAYGVVTGSNSVYLGNAAGRYLSDGMTNVTSNTNSVFIGTDSKSNLNAQDNQIVIGYNAVSNGTNTVTLGNNDITDTYVKGVLRASTAILAQVSSSYNFADDTAAQAGGVPLGGLYHTSGSIKIRLV